MKYIIDTDKLPCNNGKNCTTCPFWSVDDTCEITEQVKKLPKYEDRPHGEWIDKGEYAECSLCGSCSGTQFDGVEPIPLKTNFCPNCGADMREGDMNG